MAPEPEPTAKRAELPMRLTRLRVKNFRSIADIDIPLSPLTVLVGPNGSGKSNVVDALRFVRDVFARGLDQAVMDREGMGVIQRWGTEGITIGVTALITIQESYSEVSVNYEFKIKTGVSYDAVIEYEKLLVVLDAAESASFEFIKLPTEIYSKIESVKTGVGINLNSQIAPGIGDNTLWLPLLLLERGGVIFSTFAEQSSMHEQIADYWWGFCHMATQQLNDLLEAFLNYTLSPSELRQPQRLLRESPFDEKGQNLAAVLDRLSRNRHHNWDELRFALRQTVAGFDTLEVEKIGGYLATKLIYQTHINQPRTSYLGQESDGTIRMMGMLAALLQEPLQPCISIEEPEANIHPGALAVLAGVIDEASLRSQILVTTHSPDMLDHLPVESFLVVEKVGDTTHVGPLDASQIASVRKRLFTPGELFRMEGLQRQTEPESAA